MDRRQGARRQPAQSVHRCDPDRQGVRYTMPISRSRTCFIMKAAALAARACPHPLAIDRSGRAARVPGVVAVLYASRTCPQSAVQFTALPRGLDRRRSLRRHHAARQRHARFHRPAGRGRGGRDGSRRRGRLPPRLTIDLRGLAGRVRLRVLAVHGAGCAVAASGPARGDGQQQHLLHRNVSGGDSRRDRRCGARASATPMRCMKQTYSGAPGCSMCIWRRMCSIAWLDGDGQPTGM